MAVQPILFTHHRIDSLAATHYTQALRRTAMTVKGLHHIPLSAGIEESQFVSYGQGPVPCNPDLKSRHIELGTWRTGVVAVDQIRAQLKVPTDPRLDRCISLAGGGNRSGDFAEECPGRERHERAGGGLKWCALHNLDRSGVTGLPPSRSELCHAEGCVTDADRLSICPLRRKSVNITRSSVGKQRLLTFGANHGQRCKLAKGNEVNDVCTGARTSMHTSQTRAEPWVQIQNRAEKVDPNSISMSVEAYSTPLHKKRPLFVTATGRNGARSGKN